MTASNENTPKTDVPRGLERHLSSMGLWRFALLFTLAFGSFVWLAANLAHEFWWQPPALVNPGGAPMGRDFVGFYGAAELALQGHPASAYDRATLDAVETQTIGAPIIYTPWFYPPFVQMILAPLAAVPYLAALMIWLIPPLVGFLMIIRRFAPHWAAVVAALLFPGTIESLTIGQNGVLSALLVAAGLLQLERKPVIAGLIFGALSYKPHIALPVYAALLFGRQFQTLAAALMVALCLAGMSVLSFGFEPWIAFLQQSHNARVALEQGQISLQLMVSPFAAARVAGLSIATSYAFQAGVVLIALSALLVAWRRKGPLGPRAAVLAAAIPLISPYAFNYDLVVLMIPLIWLIQTGMKSGLKKSEIAILPIVWVIPPLGWVLSWDSHILVTPLVLLAFLYVVLRRALAPEDPVIENPVSLFAPEVLETSR